MFCATKFLNYYHHHRVRYTSARGGRAIVFAVYRTYYTDMGLRPTDERTGRPCTIPPQSNSVRCTACATYEARAVGGFHVVVVLSEALKCDTSTPTCDERPPSCTGAMEGAIASSAGHGPYCAV